MHGLKFEFWVTLAKNLTLSLVVTCQILIYKLIRH